MDDTTSQDSEDVDWLRVRKRLLAYTIKLVKTSYSDFLGTGIDEEMLVLGVSCPDIVHQVILNAIGGGNRQRKADQVELWPWLIQTVKSEVSKLANRSEGDSSKVKHIDHMTPILNNVEETIRFQPLWSNSLELVNPEALLLQKEKQDRGITKIKEAAYGDSELEELIEAMESIIVEKEATRNPKRRLLAQYLGISCDEVTNRSKRLKARIRKHEKQKITRIA